MLTRFLGAINIILLIGINSEPAQACVALVGDATRIENWVRLTPALRAQAGAAWDCEKQLIEEGFQVGFRFQISEGGGFIEPGDGFAFVIQNASLSALGEAGYALGYADDPGSPGLTGIPNSVAIEFDTWSNGDENNNHISVHPVFDTRRRFNSPDEAYSIGSTGDLPLPDMSDGAIHRVVIEYMPGTLAIYLDDLSEPVLEVAADLSTILKLDSGKAWLGFTAATFDAWENHDILDYRFAGR